MTWQIIDNSLQKTFTLKGFTTIVKQLNDLATICDELNHHPDVDIYGYKHIRFKLYTHDENKITDKDYALAKVIDELF
jgi:4a-hydroxytetrahydrobiopterin dehydratase